MHKIPIVFADSPYTTSSNIQTDSPRFGLSTSKKCRDMTFQEYLNDPLTGDYYLGTWMDNPSAREEEKRRQAWMNENKAEYKRLTGRDAE